MIELQSDKHNIPMNFQANLTQRVRIETECDLSQCYESEPDEEWDEGCKDDGPPFIWKFVDGEFKRFYKAIYPTKTEADIRDDDAVQLCQELYKDLLELPIPQRTTKDVFWDREHEKLVLIYYTLEAKKVMWLGKEETVYRFKPYDYGPEGQYDSDYGEEF